MLHKNGRCLIVSCAVLVCALAASAGPAPAQDWAAAKIEITERLQQALGLARQQSLLGIEPEGVGATAENASMEYYNRVVLPRLRAAKTCKQRDAAMAEYFGWARQMALLGTNPDDLPEPPSSSAWLQETERVCVEEAYQKCKTEHDVMAFREVIRVLLRFERQRQLLGTADEGPGELKKFDDVFRQCLNFELELEVTFPAEGQVTGTAKMILPFNLLTREGGEAPIAFENIAIWQENSNSRVLERCRIIGDLPVVVAKIEQIDGDFVQVDPENPKTALFGKSKFLELNVHLNYETGEVQGECEGGSGPFTIWQGYDFDEEDLGTPGGVLRFRDFKGEIPAGELYAHRIYTPKELAETLDGANAKLWHKPRAESK